MTFWKGLKCVLVTLACLMLVSSFMGSRLRTVVAYTPPGGWPPGQPYFTLHAVLSNYPYWGEGGGYHAIMYAVQEELAKIGIELELHFYDVGTIWAICWDEYWNVSGGPPYGWDITTGDWWLDPTGIKWLPRLVLSWMTPPLGYNIMDWQNYRADELLWNGTQTLDDEVYRRNLWLFQELYMHDPPTINMYFGRVYEVHNVHLVGYDPVVGPRDYPNYYFTDGQTTLLLLIDSDMWNCNPVLMTTYMQEAWCSAVFEALYVFGRERPLEPGEYPSSEGWTIKPQLANGTPTYYDGGRTAVIKLREDVLWSDGEPFNASDVKCTFDAVLDPDTGTWSWVDFAPIIESVEITGEYEVTFHLHEPYHDFEDLLANTWGGLIVPEHVLGDIPHREWSTHPTNYDPSLLPGTGPFMFEEWVPDDYIRLVRNPNYTRPMRGDILGKPINTVIIKIYRPEWRWFWEWFEYRLPQFDILLFHLFASKEVFEEIASWGTHEVYQYDYPAGNHIFLNLDNPILSNRYVRQAIAHAIPYPTIIDTILPEWGVEGVPPTAVIPPTQRFGVYNTELEPYEYNLTKARLYLDMWRYSTNPANWDKGPVGDADFSGFVELPDFYIWVKNFGTTPADWPWIPSRDIDPDFDNTEFVDMFDFYEWTGAWGEHYPFKGAR